MVNYLQRWRIKGPPLYGGCIWRLLIFWRYFDIIFRHYFSIIFFDVTFWHCYFLTLTFVVILSHYYCFWCYFFDVTFWRYFWRCFLMLFIMLFFDVIFDVIFLFFDLIFPKITYLDFVPQSGCVVVAFEGCWCQSIDEFDWLFLLAVVS